MPPALRYLLIEDDAAQSAILTKWLKKVASPNEIDVITVDNLEEGVQVSNEIQPVTTFLDLHLPLRKGEPTCNDWKKVADSIPRMIPPVIAVTGWDVTPEMKVYCITQRGAQNLLHKPYDEGFFQKLRNDIKLFAAQLLSESSAAVLRSERGSYVDASAAT